MTTLGSVRTATGKPYAKASFQTAWQTLRTMLRDARVLCDLEKDPTDGIRFAAQGAEPRNKDVLTQSELALILDETQHESGDVRAMIWVGMTTGMRFGELSALLWSDVDFDRRVIHVRRSLGAPSGPASTSTSPRTRCVARSTTSLDSPPARSSRGR